MRIATWNCQMGFDKKVSSLLSLNPDLAVVPECAHNSILSLQHPELSSLWFGSNPRKGIGILCSQGWQMRALPQPQQKWIIPIQVDAPMPFTLVAVWACAGGASREERYIGQVYRALIAHPEWFGQGPVIVAGDFNSNKNWDYKRKIGNHSAVVKILAAHGLVSAYHHYFDEPHGSESRPTFHQFRHRERPFHIDYVFVPQDWVGGLRAVEVGGYEQWSAMSDHNPIVVDISLLAPESPALIS